MKNRSLLKVLFVVLAAGLLTSCMGLDEFVPIKMPFHDGFVMDISNDSAFVYTLSVSVDEPENVIQCGFSYWQEDDLSDLETIQCTMVESRFETSITLCGYEETYYAKAYVVFHDGISHDGINWRLESQVDSVTLEPFEEYVECAKPKLLEYDPKQGRAEFRLEYKVVEGVEITELGMLYGTSSSRDDAEDHSTWYYDTEGDHVDAEVSVDLEPGTYYVWAYIEAGNNVVVGPRTKIELTGLPQVMTEKVENISQFRATVTGRIVDEGNVGVKERGFLCNTWAPGPNVGSYFAGAKFECGSGTGTFNYTFSDLEPGTQYYVRAYAVDINGDYMQGEILSFETTGMDDTSMDMADDISINGTANCYMISRSGTYKFPMVKGNSIESVGVVASVEVLWESFGTSTVPSVGSLIKSAFYNEDYVVFETPSSFNEGNAVIAAKDASGKILWSWHIWLTDAPGKCVYANNAGTMMDRNLGATSATPGEAGALGLLYQWGRKDPFLGSSSISSSVEAKSTISWPSPVSSSSSCGTIGYAVEHPTTFITYNDSNYDWYYTGSSSTDDTRWQSEKTIYDPCPAGWRVPDGGSNGVWSKADFKDQSYDSSDEGMLFGSGISSPVTWYPASGFRCIDGPLGLVGDSGHYWSVAPNGKFAYCLYFYYDGYVSPKVYTDRALGLSVRCLQE